MLLFEFVGELFQFDAREPEFEPLFQLPPKSTAFKPMLPPAFLFDDPGPKHGTHLSQQRLRCLNLVGRHALDFFTTQKPQPKSQVGHATVCEVQAGNLV